jgi:hypothetical protein
LRDISRSPKLDHQRMGQLDALRGFKLEHSMNIRFMNLTVCD